jgi:aspartyl-tRNA(Asn)/glutamyl-tRNA(Gln) amidotransferase subunit C
MVSHHDVHRVADLAALSLEETNVEELVSQLEEILEFIAQLQSVNPTPEHAAFRPGPSTAALRDDVVSPIPMMHGVESFAPEVRDGFLLVPKVESLGEA